MEGKDNYFDQEIGNKSIPKEGEAQAKTLDQTKASETSDNSNILMSPLLCMRILLPYLKNPKTS